MIRLFLKKYNVVILFVLMISYVNNALAQHPDFGRYHALLIANENYKYWSKLKTPVQDVTDLAKVLKNHYGFFQIYIIKNVTRDEIISKLEMLKDKLTTNDNLLIYYAGHGAIEDHAYWIGVDSSKSSHSRWLKHQTILDLLDVQNGMRARHILLIADSCYSGTLLRSNEEGRKKWFHQHVAKLPSRRALTSGGTEPVIDSVGNSRNSVFASELIAKLQHNNEILDAQTLHSRIKVEVHNRARRLARSTQAPEYGHIPGIGHEGGEFLFIPNTLVAEGLPPTPRAPTNKSFIRGEDEPSPKQPIKCRIWVGQELCEELQ
jgi:hypothetical protein